MSLTVPEAIESRRATRVYTDQPVTDEVLDRVVKLALEAPTAFNAQRADLVVVRSDEVKEGILAASGQQHLRNAPVLLIAVARAGKPQDLEEIFGPDRAGFVQRFFENADAARLRETAIKDAMLVAGFALIAAQGEGLATVPTTGWDEAKVLEAIGLGGSQEHAVGLIIGMGYPAETPEHPGRLANRRVNEHY